MRCSLNDNLDPLVTNCSLIHTLKPSATNISQFLTDTRIAGAFDIIRCGTDSGSVHPLKYMAGIGISWPSVADMSYLMLNNSGLGMYQGYCGRDATSITWSEIMIDNPTPITFTLNTAGSTYFTIRENKSAYNHKFIIIYLLLNIIAATPTSDTVYLTCASMPQNILGPIMYNKNDTVVGGFNIAGDKFYLHLTQSLTDNFISMQAVIYRT